MGFHSDAEDDLCFWRYVVSLSLGERRRFLIREIDTSRKQKENEKKKVRHWWRLSNFKYGKAASRGKEKTRYGTYFLFIHLL